MAIVLRSATIFLKFAKMIFAKPYSLQVHLKNEKTGQAVNENYFSFKTNRNLSNSLLV